MRKFVEIVCHLVEVFETQSEKFEFYQRDFVTPPRLICVCIWLNSEYQHYCTFYSTKGGLVYIFYVQVDVLSQSKIIWMPFLRRTTGI